VEEVDVVVVVVVVVCKARVHHVEAFIDN
jgi:hypothetical protein